MAASGAIPEKSAASPRILTLDVAKGMGIVLVVLGHNHLFREQARLLYEAIYLFHMPLFFFVSGTTFRLAPIRDALNRRARSLLVPYAVMGAVALAMAMNAGGVDAALRELGGLLYGTGHTIRFVPLWFLPCLFMVFTCATGVLAGLRALIGTVQFERKSTLLLLSVTCIGVLIGVVVIAMGTFAQPPYVDAKGRPVGLPWGLDLVPLALGVFVLGMLASRSRLVSDFPRPAWVAPAAIMVIAVLVAQDVSLDLNYRRMSGIAGALLGMVAGIALVLALSKLICRSNRLARLFAYLGSSSLVILMLHYVLQPRVIHPFLDFRLPTAVKVVATVSITVALICAFDFCVLRRVRAMSWVVYPRGPS
jgi:fucose 4-O-acetylase-like acetyltransferase